MEREGKDAPQAVGANGVASSRVRANSSDSSHSGDTPPSAGVPPSPPADLVLRRSRRGSLHPPGEPSSEGGRSSDPEDGPVAGRQPSAVSGGSNPRSNPSNASSRSSAAAFCAALRQIPVTGHLDAMETFLEQQGGAAPNLPSGRGDAVLASVPPPVARWAGSIELPAERRTSTPVTRSSSERTVVADGQRPVLLVASGPVMSPLPEVVVNHEMGGAGAGSDCRSTAPEASVSGEASRSLPSDPSDPSHHDSHGKASMRSAGTTSSVGSTISSVVDDMRRQPRTFNDASMTDFLSQPLDAAKRFESDSDAAASDVWDWSMLTLDDVVDLRGLCLSNLQLQIWMNLSAIHGFGLYTDTFPSGVRADILVSNGDLREAHGGCYDGVALMDSATPASTFTMLQMDYPHMPTDALQQVRRGIHRSKCAVRSFILSGQQQWVKSHWVALMRLVREMKLSIERIKLPHIGGMGDVVYAFEDFNYEFSRSLLLCESLYALDWFQRDIQSDGLLYLFMSLAFSLVERLHLLGLSDEDTEAMSERSPFFTMGHQEGGGGKITSQAYQARLVAQLNVFLGNDADRIDMKPPPFPCDDDWSRFFATLGMAVLHMQGMDKRINLWLGRGFDDHQMNRLSALLMADAPVSLLDLTDSSVRKRATIARFTRAMQNNHHLAHLVLPKGVDWRKQSILMLICQGVQDCSALRVLHVPRCQMSSQALKQVIGAVLENGGIRQLVFESVELTDKINEHGVKVWIKAQVESARERASLLRQVRLNGVDYQSKLDKTGLCGLISQLPATYRVPASLVHRHNETIDEASRRQPNEAYLFGKRWRFPPSFGQVIAMAPPLKDEVDLAFYQNHLPWIKMMLRSILESMSKIFTIQYDEDLLTGEDARLAASRGDACEFHYYKYCIADSMRSFAGRVNEQYRAHFHLPICDLDEASIERYVNRALSWWFAFADHGASRPKPLFVMLMSLFVETAADCGLETTKDVKDAAVLATGGYFYGQGGQMVVTALTPGQKALINMAAHAAWLRPEAAARHRRNEMLLRAVIAIVASAILFGVVFAALPHVHLGLAFLVGMSLLEKTATCWGMLMGAITLVGLYEKGLAWANRMDAQRDAARAAKVEDLDGVTMNAEHATRQCVQQFFGSKPRRVNESPLQPIRGKRAGLLFFDRPKPMTVHDDELAIAPVATTTL